MNAVIMKQTKQVRIGKEKVLFKEGEMYSAEPSKDKPAMPKRVMDAYLDMGICAKVDTPKTDIKPAAQPKAEFKKDA